MKILTWLISTVVIVAVAWIITAQALISAQSPVSRENLRGDPRFDFAALLPNGMQGLPTLENYTARDSTLMAYRHYGSSRKTHIKLYLLHSAGWHGMEFHTLASQLAYSLGVADVFVPDLRGHGSSPLHRGDIAYEGQLDDDLADLIKQTAGKDDIVIVGGHSEGGGLAVRFASGKYSKMANAYLLLAPVLSLQFPASRPDLGGWIKPLGKRIMGLEMLNDMGFHWADNTVAYQYALPSSLRDGSLGFTVTTDYSWRLFKSMETRNSDGSDLAAVKSPLLVISGSKDSVIFPDRLQSAIEHFTDRGEYKIVPEENHLSIVNSPKTLTIIQNWMANLP